MNRKSVHEPLATGIKAIDALFQLVVVNVSLSLVIDKLVKLQLQSMQSLTKKVMVLSCVYVAIGQKESTVAKLFVV